MEKGETAPSEGAAKRWRHDTQLARKCFQDSQRFDDVLRQHDGERISFDVAVEIARMAPVHPSQDSPLIRFKEWLKGQLLMLVEASDGDVPDGGVLVVTQKFLIHVGYAEYVIDTLVKAFQAERSDGPPILISSERANWLRGGVKRHIRDATDDDGCFDVTVSVPLVGHYPDAMLWIPQNRDDGGRTPNTHKLAQAFSQKLAQVLIVDGVTDAFGGDENQRRDVYAFRNSARQQNLWVNLGSGRAPSA